MERLIGSWGVWRGLPNLIQGPLSKSFPHLVHHGSCLKWWQVEGLKKGGVFELVMQDGGHELKEKEVGDDPDYQIQQSHGLSIHWWYKDQPGSLAVSDSINLRYWACDDEIWLCVLMCCENLRIKWFESFPGCLKSCGLVIVSEMLSSGS